MPTPYPLPSPTHSPSHPSHPRTSPTLHTLYPWTQPPFICSAPMRLISTAKLAVAVTLAGGLGFIAAGDDLSNLDAHFTEARKLLSEAGWKGNGSGKGRGESESTDVLPIGVGFFAWGVSARDAAPVLRKHRPAAIWLFAPHDDSHASMREWTETFTRASASEDSQTPYQPHFWVQAGTVSEALGALQALGQALTVLVIQGHDAGGHGLSQSASLMTLLPETVDALQSFHSSHGSDSASEHPAPHTPLVVAAGGIADGRGAAAALVLGANGICMGTRFLASHEAVVAGGYRAAVLEASDGGAVTVRTKLYDVLRGTTKWPPRYAGRGVTNASWDDFVAGKVTDEENKNLYEEAVKQGDQGWGLKGRMTTYAGTAVGLVRRAQSAKDIIDEVREECGKVMNRMSHKL